MTTHTTVLVITAVVLACFTYWLGWRDGRKYGRDEQFNDDFIAQGRKDAARRDRDGRFKRVEESKP